MRWFIPLAVLVVCVNVFEAKDFVLGTRSNNLLISTEKIVYRRIPLIKRDKEYTYTDTKDRIIKAVIARDLARTGGEVSLVSGGLGNTSVTLHFESERGVGLNYLVLIFTNKADTKR
ncbi:hypothetical protein JYU34_004139 [Plutella xylostella]|uniref:Salivary secreted peptide n=1 Tax=Plutella xylostella TaxID=51655 RepID=A0ABQ7QX81_PLUXY|nr:uncharacterized protein LOC105390653 [Plutella xylostella]KAG7309653.1 hypothetical protein JYU34_004139 [Plutella xylostella]